MIVISDSKFGSEQSSFSKQANISFEQMHGSNIIADRTDLCGRYPASNFRNCIEYSFDWKALKFLECLLYFSKSNKLIHLDYLKFEDKDNAMLGIPKFKFLRFKNTYNLESLKWLY